MRVFQQISLTVLNDPQNRKRTVMWQPDIITPAEAQAINERLPPTATQRATGLKGDLGIKGLIQAGSGVIMLDGRCTYPDLTRLIEQRKGIDDILRGAEEEKQRTYGAACQRNGHKFLPFVWTPCGVLGKAARSIINLMADRLARQWHRPKGRCKGWINGQLAIAIARATSACIRKLRGTIGAAAYDMPTYDGAAIASGVIRF
jgi:hypothetical protein